MPLTDAEIILGAVAYFDVATLNADPRLTIKGAVVDLGDGTRGVQPLTRDGPCVCVERQADQATWTPVTNREQAKFKRLRIQKSWVIDGYDELGAGESFLQDGANTYAGPVACFIAAAAGETPFGSRKRPTITPEGLAAIREEIDKQQPRARVLKR